MRYKLRKQDLTLTSCRLDVLNSRLHEGLEVEYRLVADSAGQEGVVGSAQLIVLAPAWASCDAAVQHYLENFAFQNPNLQLEGSTRSLIKFDGGHSGVAGGVAYAPVDFYGQVGVMVHVPPSYTLPAALTLNVAGALVISLVREHIFALLASETVRPNAAHTLTITTIIFLK